MSRFKLFRLKNQMFFFNLIAISIGVSQSVFILSYRLHFSADTGNRKVDVSSLRCYFEPLAVSCSCLAATLLFEHPIRRYLNFMGRQRNHTLGKLQSRHGKGYLNEPFFIIAIDFIIMACCCCGLSHLSYYTYKAGEMIIGRALFQNILIGLITV